ncbi:Sirohydrochlorin cobaltochelatase [Candidatus Hodgkinia cicadicola]|nr:Sirohydrochlorin cobaltochelatase [Candidatus Hodgkinia cicadicola]
MLRLFFVGHGSANASAASEFAYVVDLFRLSHLWIDVRCWVLEFGKLSLASCFGASVRICVIAPVMLFSSRHVKYDLCTVTGFLQSLNKFGVVLLAIELCSVLLTTKIIARLINALTIGSAILDGSWINSIAVMVFRGGSELGANTLAHSLTRAVWEGSGCLWCEACYFGLTFPLVNVVKLLASPTRGVVFLPMLLFFGDLYLSLCECKSVAGYVFSTVAAVKVLFKHLERVLFEFSLGECNLCKYRLVV